LSAKRYVVDASALLAMMAREPSGDVVAMFLSATTSSAVN
jgi:PIN domain nuclease of toxin-antitoxin system